MREYPSRSNLNCFFSFNEASAKGGALLKFRSWFVDNLKTEKAIIFFWLSLKDSNLDSLDQNQLSCH